MKEDGYETLVHAAHAAITINLWLLGGDVGLVSAIRASRTLEACLARFKKALETPQEE